MIAGLVPFTLIDYPGKPAATIFFAGCPWRCWYCHNKDVVLGRVDKDLKWDNVYDFLKMRVSLLKGVVFSGGEPLLYDLWQYILPLKQLGYNIKVDTNGAYPYRLEMLIRDGLVDFIAMDIKAPLEKYREVIGVTWDIDKIKQSIDLIKKSKLPHQFRTTYDDGFGFAIDELEALVGEKIVVQPCNRTLAAIPWTEPGGMNP